MSIYPLSLLLRNILSKIMINIINTIAPNPKANTFKISVLKDEMNFAKNKNRIPKNRTEIIQNNNQVNLGFVNPRILS